MLTTETERLQRIAEINAKPMTREELEAEFGQVWTTPELADFVITAFVRPLIVVRRKSDGVVGTLAVQEKSRFYFDFRQRDVD